MQSGCIPEGSRVLVAVSGGADSVALLSLLHQLADSMDLHLRAAHLDHALRDTSCADAQFVERLCADLGVPLVVERRDVAGIAKQRKGNLEEVARDIRRDFLESVAQSRNCQLIALGHHADDQAETFLLRLLRGSGPAGLAGMRLVNQLVVRPLLSFHRDELLAYLQEEGIAWREDESNLDQTFTRNRVRHSLLPLLESYNPNISGQLAGLCELMRQDDDFWVALVAQELARCGKWRDDDYTLERSLLLDLAPALIGRVIRAALQQVRGDLRGVTATHIADVLKLARADSPQGELNLPGVWIARRYEKLLFSKRKPELAEHFAVVLSVPGNYSLPGGQILQVSLAEQSLGESADTVEFAAASVSFPLQLRHCQPGDRLRPSGMSGTKKLQDLFVDLKLTKEERQKALVVLVDDEVLWVVGLRRSEGRRPRDGEAVLQLVIKP
ncbi:MAG: tRNA lysidine(34) synthetase TilS [Desulfuromonadales bacterium]|nr:tRNA lysidine(34) synthetase TilS [Desulfuromonadales bacterium]